MFFNGIYRLNTFIKSIFWVIGILFSPAIYPLQWCEHYYVSVEKFKHIANFVIEKNGECNFNPSEALEGDVIFIKTDTLNYFFTTIFPKLPPIIIITHDSYEPSPGLFVKYLNHPKIIHWFGTNGDIHSHPKFTHIPVGIAQEKWTLEDRRMLDGLLDIFDRGYRIHQDIKMYVNFSSATNKDRVILLEKFSDKSFVVNASSKGLQEYLAEMAQYRYVLCPPGKGSDSHRIWDALLVGSIPVVKSSTLDTLYQDLPVIIINSWDDITLENLESIYHKRHMIKYLTKSYRTKLSFQYWKELIFSKYRSKRNYISGDEFRKLADFVIDRASQQTINSTAVGPGSIIFVETSFLDFFFSTVFPKLLHPIVLVTQNSDLPAPGEFASYLDDPKIIRWFGQNCNITPLHPKFTPIPIGIANQEWKNGKRKIYDNLLDYFESNTNSSPRKNRLYINWKGRTELYKYFENNKFAFLASKKPFKDYLKEMSEYRYVLSPFGAGLDCFRTWEALLIGCIPVVKTSTLDPLYEDLPVIIVQNWSDITEEKLEKEYERIKNRPFKQEKLFMAYWTDLLLKYRATVIKDSPTPLKLKNHNQWISCQFFKYLAAFFILLLILLIIKRIRSSS